MEFVVNSCPTRLLNFQDSIPKGAKMVVVSYNLITDAKFQRDAEAQIFDLVILDEPWRPKAWIGCFKGSLCFDVLMLHYVRPTPTVID